MISTTIHPSSVATFFDCPYKWMRNNLYKPIRSVSSAAHIGSAVHKGAELFYKDTIASGAWQNPSNSAYSDACVETFKNKFKDERPSDANEINEDDTIRAILARKDAYLQNARGFLNNEIPIAVEKRYQLEYKNYTISGTCDIIANDLSIVDIKTMARKMPARNYWIQQGIYAHLFFQNHDAIMPKDLQIHRVIARKDGAACDSVSICDGGEDDTFMRVGDISRRAMALVDSMIETLNEFHYKAGDSRTLFRGNPQSPLCSAKFCAYYHDCDYAKI